MKIRKTCPICKAKLEAKTISYDKEKINFICDMNDHKIIYHIYIFSPNVVYSLEVFLNNEELVIYFNPKLSKVFLSVDNSYCRGWVNIVHKDTSISVQYFNPNLSNLPKFINKIKSYIIFK